MYVSSATPTTISKLVPPIVTVAGSFDKLLNRIGSPAIITRNTPPIIVSFDKIFDIYFSVSLPGLTPGIKPPFSF